MLSQNHPREAVLEAHVLGGRSLYILRAFSNLIHCRSCGKVGL